MKTLKTIFLFTFVELGMTAPSEIDRIKISLKKELDLED